MPEARKPRCERRTGTHDTPCNNSASWSAQADWDRFPIQVCGTHANSLSLRPGWTVTELSRG